MHLHGFIFIIRDHLFCQALSILPDLKQEVQTCIVLAPPVVFTRTVLMFDFQILLDLL